jgi:hypothetical protein
MPKFNTLTEAQIEKLLKRKAKGSSKRSETREQYKELLVSIKPGEWNSVELDENEHKQTVKGHIIKAAVATGFKANFIRTRGAIVFQLTPKEEQ